MKIEWLVTNVTAVISPDRAERLALIALLRVVCWPIQAVFVLQEPLCDVGTPS